MNNSTQAQKGFQTFVLTLSISLILFSIIYYFVTNTDSEKPNIARDMDSDVTVVDKEVSMEEVSVFKKLADQEINVEKRAVLAGAADGLTNPSPVATESTVPDTGSVSITAGFIGSAILFLLSALYIVRGPRGLALSKFENQFFKE